MKKPKRLFFFFIAVLGLAAIIIIAGGIIIFVFKLGGMLGVAMFLVSIIGYFCAK